MRTLSRAAGIYETYAEDLASRAMPNQQVYSVTPKGNTLVFLAKDGGQSKPKHDPGTESVFESLQGLRPA